MGTVLLVSLCETKRTVPTVSLKRAGPFSAVSPGADGFGCETGETVPVKRELFHCFRRERMALVVVSFRFENQVETFHNSIFEALMENFN